MTMLWIVGGLMAVGLIVAVSLVVAITGQGGEREGEAGTFAGSILDQSAAFRGDRPEGRGAWDGVDRQKTGPGDPGGGGF